MKLMKNNKQIGAIQGFVMGVVTIGVLLAVGLIVLQNLSDASRVGGVSTGATTSASNATDTIITKLATAPTWIGILIVVAFASAVLAYFYMRGKGQ